MLSFSAPSNSLIVLCLLCLSACASVKTPTIQTSSPAALPPVPTQEEQKIAAGESACHLAIASALSNAAMSFAKEKKQWEETPTCQSAEPQPLPVISTPLLPVIGQIERVFIEEGDFSTPARIDTGATTTSMSAIHIKKFERDGVKWVRFDVPHDDGTFTEMEHKIDRTVLIRRHGEDPQERYVVNLHIKLGDITRLIEVTLTDRREFDFTVLIGRNFLENNYMVDVSKKYTFSMN